MTDCQFCQYFGMSKYIFQLLCNQIEDIFGRDEFKSEDFLDEIMNCDNPCHRRMLIANECTSGGFICGEINLAMALCILGGGSPLDMALLVGTSSPL